MVAFERKLQDPQLLHVGSWCPANLGWRRASSRRADLGRTNFEKCSVHDGHLMIFSGFLMFVLFLLALADSDFCKTRCTEIASTWCWSFEPLALSSSGRGPRLTSKSVWGPTAECHQIQSFIAATKATETNQAVIFMVEFYTLLNGFPIHFSPSW